MPRHFFFFQNEVSKSTNNIFVNDGPLKLNLFYYINNVFRINLQLGLMESLMKITKKVFIIDELSPRLPLTLRTPFISILKFHSILNSGNFLT